MPARRNIKIKVCGIVSVADARLVAEAGADYIGVIIEVATSPRRLSVEQARPICEQSTLPVVALFFNGSARQIQRAVEVLHPYAVQLMGQEPASLVSTLKRTTNSEVWKTIHLPAEGQGEVDIAEYQDRVMSFIAAGVDALVLDTVVASAPGELRYGGTGQVNNWSIARRMVAAIPVPTFLAGGLNPLNVRAAIESVHPYGIDLCSGVELAPGQKDPEKLRRLVAAVRGAASVKSTG